MLVEKSLRVFATTHQNLFKHLFLASFFTASQRLASATHRLVSHCWSKRSNKMIRQQLTSWPATVTGLKNIAKLNAIHFAVY